MFHRWVSLITVMAGVSLVGLSGSMVKDAVKEPGVNTFGEIPPPEPIEEPEVTKVLVGQSNLHCPQSAVPSSDLVPQACSSFCSPKSCTFFLPSFHIGSSYGHSPVSPPVSPRLLTYSSIVVRTHR